MRARTARRKLGIPLSTRLRGEHGLRIVEAAAKTLIVDARRANDDEKAAELSEAKAYLKKLCHVGFHCVCGVPISPGAEFCQMCANEIRFYKPRPKMISM